MMLHNQEQHLLDIHLKNKGFTSMEAVDIVANLLDIHLKNKGFTSKK